MGKKIYYTPLQTEINHLAPVRIYRVRKLGQIWPPSGDFVDKLKLINHLLSKTAAEEHNNEIEDTRNSKAQNTSNDFVRAYQALIWESAKKWKENGTRGGRGLFRNILNYARELKDTTTDILENHDCFLRVFLYQGLLGSVILFIFQSNLIAFQ